jgi:DNA-binding LacI/PurR family transcriptional regulator/transposase-like protein
MATLANPLKTRSKPQELCEHLQVLAQRLGPGAKFPTVSEICRQFGVSLGTLNSALAQLELQGVVERRHGVGIFVAAHLPVAAPKVLNVALVCAAWYLRTANSPFWNLLLDVANEKGASRGLKMSGYLELAQKDGADELSDALVYNIESGNIHAVVSIGLVESAVRWIEAQGIPVVSYAGHSSCIVVSDSEKICVRAVQKLKSRGCERIALWMPILANVPIHNFDGARDTEIKRHETLKNIFSGHGLQWQEDLYRNLRAEWLAMQPSGENTANVIPQEKLQEQGYRLVKEVFSQPRSAWPDGLFISDDLMTHGALNTWRKLGLEPERDFQVATHANAGSPVLAGEDHLLRITMHPADIAEALFVSLEERMKNPLAPAQIVRVPPQDN